MSSGPWAPPGRMRRIAATLAAGVVLVTVPGSTAWADGVTFYVPQPNAGAIVQIEALVSAGHWEDAALLAKMLNTPTASWFTTGTPSEVKTAVAATVRAAQRKRAVPVLVAYNVPARDCSQYSAGGAASDAAYRAWIDGFAAGVGNAPALVIVEPDGLALLPSDCGQEATPTGPITRGRFADVAYAARKLGGLRGAKVYLDAGHSHGQSVAAMTDRLIKGGVSDADGFSVNTSSYQTTKGLQQYGSWIARCIAFVTEQSGAGSTCADQYHPATVSDESTWHLTDEWYAANVTAAPTAHFVIDTSRNGNGPWMPPADHPAGDPQDWCNPPARGNGPHPTIRTGNALNDAFVWIKVPGESDGQCHRWGPGPKDPARNLTAPAAGQWFPEMALELARNAAR
jgi:endoglucanase